MINFSQPDFYQPNSKESVEVIRFLDSMELCFLATSPLYG